MEEILSLVGMGILVSSYNYSRKVEVGRVGRKVLNILKAFGIALIIISVFL